MVEIGEHYRPIGDAHPAGTYRVVGARGDVTVLRVADAGGRRRYTGELLQVDARTLEASFEPASDPDAGIRPLGIVRDALQGIYWSVRRFLPP